MKCPLRPYQSAAIESLRASLRAGHRRPLLQLPTGGGKTLVAGAIIEMARQKGNRIAFVVPALELVRQTLAALEAEGIHEIGVLQGSHERTDPAAPVQIVSSATLARRDYPAVDMAIIDEAHVLPKVLKRWMKANPRMTFIGLSASPWSKGLGKWFDDLVVAVTMGSLIRDGFLANFRAFAPQRPDLSGVRILAGDYDADQLAVAMNQLWLTDLVVSEWIERAKGRPTLCFCVDLAHARAVQAAFTQAGIKTGYMDGSTGRGERDAIREDFHAGRIEIVVNVGVLTVGIDWYVECILLARPTKSEILLAQIVGRALRPADGKDFALLLDLSGSMQDLGLPTDLGQAHLDGDRRRHTPKPAVLPIPCPKCSFLHRPTVKKCFNCGYVVPEPTPQERLDRLTAIIAADRFGRRRLWSGLLWSAREYRLSEKWALANFHGAFGDWPHGLSDRPMKPDAEVRDWLAASRAAWLARQREAA